MHNQIAVLRTRNGRNQTAPKLPIRLKNIPKPNSKSQVKKKTEARNTMSVVSERSSSRMTLSSPSGLFADAIKTSKPAHVPTRAPNMENR